MPTNDFSPIAGGDGEHQTGRGSSVLAVAVFTFKTLRGQQNVNVMERLKAIALRSGVVEMGDELAFRRVNSSESVNARYASLLLSPVKPTARRESPEKMKSSRKLCWRGGW